MQRRQDTTRSSSGNGCLSWPKVKVKSFISLAAHISSNHAPTTHTVKQYSHLPDRNYRNQASTMSAAASTKLMPRKFTSTTTSIPPTQQLSYLMLSTM